MVVCVLVIVVSEGSEAVGDVVEAWRQREGVKKDVGVEVGALDWHRGGRYGLSRVVFKDNCGAVRARDDKLRRLVERARVRGTERLHEKTTLTPRTGKTASRSPNCAVATIMKLMVGERENQTPANLKLG